MRKAVLTIGYATFLMPSLEKANKVAELMQHAVPIQHGPHFSGEVKTLTTPLHLEVTLLTNETVINDGGKKQKTPRSPKS